MKFPPLILAAFFSLTSSGWAGLVINFDPADLMVTSTGMDQVVDVGILIRWDGMGGMDADTLSAFTLGFNETSPSLEVIEGDGAPSDFSWNAIPLEVTSTNVGGGNLTPHVIDETGTQLLATLQFTLDAAFTSGTIPINLGFVDAQRGTFPMYATIQDSEIMVSGGDLVVSAAAVPEPASLAMMGLAACGAIGLRRRRKVAPSEQAV